VATCMLRPSLCSHNGLLPISETTNPISRTQLYRRPRSLWTPEPVNLVSNNYDNSPPSDRMWLYEGMSAARESFRTHLTYADQSERRTTFSVILWTSHAQLNCLGRHRYVVGFTVRGMRKYGMVSSSIRVTL
jgi:hypothetical protein